MAKIYMIFKEIFINKKYSILYNYSAILFCSMMQSKYQYDCFVILCFFFYFNIIYLIFYCLRACFFVNSVKELLTSFLAFFEGSLLVYICIIENMLLTDKVINEFSSTLAFIIISYVYFIAIFKQYILIPKNYVTRICIAFAAGFIYLLPLFWFIGTYNYKMYYNEELFNSLDLAFKESFITGLMDVIGNGMKVVGGGFKHEEVIFFILVPFGATLSMKIIEYYLKKNEYRRIVFGVYDSYKNK